MCFKEVSGKGQWCFKKFSRVFQVRLKGVSSSFKEVSGVFKRSLKGSMVFQGSLKIVNEVSRVLQESFEGSSRKF